MLKDGKEGEYEREGYGKRLYTNWKKVMFSTEGEVCHLTTLCLLWDVFSIVCDVMSCLFWQSAPCPAVETGDVTWVQDFDTVMKAIASNTERWGIFDVDMELKRYLGEQQA